MTPDILASRTAATRPSPAKTKVYFTVDVESSAGGSWSRPELRPLPEQNDILDRFPKEAQLSLLTEAMGFFAECAGFRPTAFRAGCYAATRTTLQCLAELGIAIDSSLNLCYPHLSFAGESFEPNRA